MSRRTGRVSIAGMLTSISVLLLIGCSKIPDAHGGARPGSLPDRVAALEQRQLQLEAQVKTLLAQLDARKGGTGARPTSIKANAAPPNLVDIAGLPAAGAANAPVVLLEYSDFQCPYCRSYSTSTRPVLDREYVRTGRVRYVFHHLPLGRIHPAAFGAATAAVCADRQGRFWEMHDRLFEDPRNLAQGALTELATALRLDVSRFSTCMTGDAAEQVERQVANALRLGITSTPTFLIGRLESAGHLRVVRRIAGAQPFAVFKDVIDGIDSPGDSDGRRR